MFTDPTTLHRLLSLPFHAAQRPRLPHSPRASFPHVAAAYGAFATLRPLVGLAQEADNWLFPEHKAQPVKKPVLVYANARSGTTLLHHLLSLDHDRFAPLKMYQTILPSVSMQKMVNTAKKIDDRWFSGWLEKGIDASNGFFFRAWDGVHQTGINRLEEDESLFVYSLLSPALLFVSPHFREHERILTLDTLDEATRQRFMRYYIGSMRRILYAAGENKTLLNKSIWVPGRLRTQLEMFPDTEFVYLIRNPLESIPSFINLFYQAWKVFFPNLPRIGPQTRGIADLAVRHYLEAHAMRAHIPAHQQMVLRFSDLIRQPKASVQAVYQHFDWAWSDRHGVAIEQALQGVREFKSKERYTLESFGIEAQEVYETLREVFDCYDFAPPAPDGKVDPSRSLR